MSLVHGDGMGITNPQEPENLPNFSSGQRERKGQHKCVVSGSISLSPQDMHSTSAPHLRINKLRGEEPPLPTVTGYMDSVNHRRARGSPKKNPCTCLVMLVLLCWLKKLSNF